MLGGRGRGRLIASAAYATDKGWVRDGNEDAAAAVRLPGAAGTPWVWAAAVADGIGGTAGGEVASRSAVDAFILAVQSLLADGISDPARLTERGFAEANAEIAGRAQSVPGNSEMGTTLTTALLWGRRLWVGHIGDSRLYVVRRGQTRQITTDHSVRGMLARYVGAGSPQVPDIVFQDLRDGDVAVLCTDGLYRRLESGIAGILRASGDISTACEDLVAAAKERDGSDNITAACIAVGRKVFRKPVSVRRRSIAVLLLAVLLAMCVVIWKLAKHEAPAGGTGTAAATAAPDAVRLELEAQDGRLQISEGWASVRVGRAIALHDGTDTGVARLADQRITVSLAPAAERGKVQLTFERSGHAKPSTPGWSIDGSVWVQKKSALVDRPKESIAFNMAGRDGGADVPVEILFGRDLPGTAVEAGAALTLPATTNPEVPSRQSSRLRHRYRGGGAKRPVSSADSRGRRGAPTRAAGMTAASAQGPLSAKESTDRDGSKSADTRQD